MGIRKKLRKIRRQGKKRGKKVPEFDVEKTIRGARRRLGSGA